MRLRFYIYFHIRPDTGKVFYVGRGTLAPRAITPARAYSLKGRNSLWKGIVSRNDGKYLIQIKDWYETVAEVNDAEIKFIKEFGKIIDGSGNLCNLTDGGEGTVGHIHSEETRAKMIAAHVNNPERSERLRSEEFKSQRKLKLPNGVKNRLGCKATDETKAKQSKSHLYKNAKCVVDVSNGKVYDRVSDAALAIGIGADTLYKALNGQRINKTTMVYKNGM